MKTEERKEEDEQTFYVKLTEKAACFLKTHLLDILDIDLLSS